MTGLNIALSLGLIVAVGVAIWLFFSLLGRIERVEKQLKVFERAQLVAKARPMLDKVIEGKLTMHHQLQTATLPAKFEITKRKRGF